MSGFEKPADATLLAGTPVSPTAPAAGQGLVYASGSWGPAALGAVMQTALLAAAVDVAASTATELLTITLGSGRWTVVGMADLLIPAGTALGAVTGALWIADGSTVYGAIDILELQALSAAGAGQLVVTEADLAAEATLSLMVETSVAVTAEPAPQNVAGLASATGLYAIYGG